MRDAASVSRALKGRKSGNGYLVRCPAHADALPSLLISDRDDGAGIRVNCFAGWTSATFSTRSASAA